MNARSGFSLLEVLIAIVLLAIVVAVCVPYLKVNQASSDPAGRASAFHLRVADAIANEHGPGLHLISLEQYSSLASLNGWACERLEQDSMLTDEPESAGYWVKISDGELSALYWAVLEEGHSP